MMKKLLCLCALLSLASCSSTPESNYYLLRAKATDITSPIDGSIGIGPVTVSEYLNRPQITVSGDSGELNIEQYQRWGEPLRNSIERVLMENLSSLTGSSDLIVHPWRQSQRPRYAVRVNILSMNRQATTATIKVQWQVIDSKNGSTLATRLERYDSELANSEFKDLVEGYSNALLQLSEDIASALRR